MMNRRCAMCGPGTYCSTCGRDDVADWVRGIVGQGDHIREEGTNRTGIVISFFKMWVNGRLDEHLQIDYGVNDCAWINYNSIDCIYTDVDGVKIYRLK